MSAKGGQMPARFELYIEKDDGTKGETVANGNLRTVADYVRSHHLLSHRDDSSLGTFYVHPENNTIYRVDFCLDLEWTL